MRAVPFDTLKLAGRLQSAGFTNNPARGAWAASAEATSGGGGATKADLGAFARHTETKIEVVKGDIVRRLVPLLFVQPALTAAIAKRL